MRGPFLRFVAGIFSVINNSCRTTIVGVQRQQGRVLTSDNDHHHPPLTSADICCSVQSCSDAVRAANHYSDSNTSGANITTVKLQTASPSHSAHAWLTAPCHPDQAPDGHSLAILTRSPGSPSLSLVSSPVNSLSLWCTAPPPPAAPPGRPLLRPPPIGARPGIFSSSSNRMSLEY